MFTWAKYAGNHKNVNKLNSSIKGQSLRFFSTTSCIIIHTPKINISNKIKNKILENYMIGKSFTEQKLREFSTTKPALQQMLKELL